MLITPRPGISLDNLIQSLGSVRTSASNRVSGVRPAHKRLLAYLEWASEAARMLGYQISEADLASLVLNRRYELLLSSFGTMAGPEMEVQRVVNDLVTLELDERVKDFDEAIKTLDSYRKRWVSGVDLVVLDTGFYIKHSKKLEEADIAAAAGTPGSAVHVLVPMIVVDELDGLKRASPPTTTGCSTPGCCCACTSMTTMPSWVVRSSRTPVRSLGTITGVTPPGITPFDGTTLPPNNTWNASNVHEARNALGKRLRELRSAAGISGRRLAESLAWPPSKVSKLENGRQTPTDDDIRDWTRATHSEDETEGLLASLHTLEVQHAEWQRILRTGLKPRQQELIEWDQKTRLFRAFEATVVPGLLQTAGYARARFAEGIRRLKLPNDINEVVAARVQRQEILYRPDKRFHFVLTEAALRLRLCPPEVMLGQLDRLMSFSQLPNVRLGIIGFDTQYATSPWHGFWLYDNERVLIETFSASLDLRQPQEIELYETVFEQLAAVASYGRAARGIVNRVIDSFASEATDNGENP